MNEFNAKCASKVVDAARIFETEHSFQADRNAGIKAVDVWLSRYAGEMSEATVSKANKEKK